ncbi:MAG TPA: hypothetical protein PLC65_00745, partial [Bacteroidia bacterium]|nr:hypothetical protein [Bacteroidia bacterium]
RALKQTKFFDVQKQDINQEEARELIATGKYLIGIFIPEKSTTRLREKASQRISKLFPAEDTLPSVVDTASLQLKLYFDPITKQSFKVSISGAIGRIVSALEM